MNKNLNYLSKAKSLRKLKKRGDVGEENMVGLIGMGDGEGKGELIVGAHT